MTKPSKNPADDIIYISLVDLQNQTDKNIAPRTLPIWMRYMELILKGTKHAGNPEMTSNLTIVTSQADILYLQQVVEYLEDTPASHIQSYLWLSTIEELVLHTTSAMRLLHSEYMRVVIGTEGSTPRSLYCANGVNSLFGMAVSYVLADEAFTRDKLPRVQRMLSDIRRSFDRLVKSTSWMDEATKRKTIQKSAEMKSFIGFPSWLRNASALNAHYEGAEVNASTHLENLMDFTHWQMMDKLNEMDKPEPIGWATSPSNVNAFHTFQSNAISESAQWEKSLCSLIPTYLSLCSRAHCHPAIPLLRPGSRVSPPDSTEHRALAQPRCRHVSAPHLALIPSRNTPNPA